MEDEYAVMQLGSTAFVVTTRRVWERHYKKSHLLVAEGLTHQEAFALCDLLNSGEQDEP